MGQDKSRPGHLLLGKMGVVLGRQLFWGSQGIIHTTSNKPKECCCIHVPYVHKDVKVETVRLSHYCNNTMDLCGALCVRKNSVSHVNWGRQGCLGR